MKGFNAGIDMEMQSESYKNHLLELVQEGKVSEEAIDRACYRVLELKFNLGLFDNPYSEVSERHILTDEHKEVARQLSRESMVLLKNEGVLPLAKNKRIALIDPLADAPRDQNGTWTMDGRPEETITPLRYFKERLGANLLYAPGLETSRTTDKSGFSAALSTARQADVVLLLLGEEQILSGEARCRAFLDLPGAQEELLEILHAAGKPIVTVIMSGRPNIFQEVTKKSEALLYAFHPGTMGGPALYDLVFGEHSPSGRLTLSFPRAVGQIPIYYNKKNTGRPPKEGNEGVPTGDPQNPIGYVSSYLDVSVLPEYPYGYGLTYTDFDYSNLLLKDSVIGVQDTLEVLVTITNKGAYEALEVVQLYTRDLYASLTRPVRELKVFERVRLKPGEAQEVIFRLPAQQLGFYGIDDKFVVEPGQFHLWVAPNSQEGLQTSFYLE